MHEVADYLFGSGCCCVNFALGLELGIGSLEAISPSCMYVYEMWKCNFDEV